MSDLTRSMEQAYEVAKKNGATVVASAPTILLLDLDTQSSQKQYERLRPALKEHFGLVGEKRWPSKSGNLHVVVTLGRELPVAMRIALQAALGSDPMRELLGVRRIELGIEEPSLLFQPQAAEVREQDVSQVPTGTPRGRKFWLQEDSE